MPHRCIIPQYSQIFSFTFISKDLNDYSPLEGVSLVYFTPLSRS
jgi:hypothetical protein